MLTRIFVPSLAALLIAVQAAGAADPKPELVGTLEVWPDLRIRLDRSFAEQTEAEAFKRHQASFALRPVMVTLLAEGKVVRQREAVATDPREGVYRGVEWKNLPPGKFDVRLEGDGFQTVVKKGVVVTAGAETKVEADLLAGKGVRVIEFGVDDTTALELLARIKKLEAQVEAVKASR